MKKQNSIYKFKCLGCNNVFAYDKPLDFLYFCPYCGLDLDMDYSKKGEIIYETQRIDS